MVLFPGGYATINDSTVTQNGSMDYPRRNREISLGYHKWDTLFKD